MSNGDDPLDTVRLQLRQDSPTLLGEGERDGLVTSFLRNADRNADEKNPVITRQLPDDEASTLRAELNIPAGWSLETLDYELGLFLPTHQGYRYVVHGTPLTNITTLVTPEGQAGWRCHVRDGILEIQAGHSFPPVHPHALFTQEDGSPGFAIAIEPLERFPGLEVHSRVIVAFSLLALSRRIYPGSGPVFAERRWHPHVGIQGYIGGLELPHDPKDVERARQSFPLFDQVKKLRSRPGPVPKPRAEIVAAYVQGAIKCGAPDRTPEWADIYEAMGGAYDTAYRARTRVLEDRGEERLEIEEVMERAKALKKQEDLS